MKSPLAFWTGTAFVVGTHAWMIAQMMPASVQKYHAAGNLAAAALMVYGAM